MTYDAAQYRIIVTCKHNIMDTIWLQSTSQKCILYFVGNINMVVSSSMVVRGQRGCPYRTEVKHECPSYVFSSAQQHHILSCCTDGEHDYYREHRERGTEQMSPRGAGAGDCACVRPVTGSTTISREQQVQDCGCTDTARSSASTSTQHPRRLLMHSTLLSSSPKSPCGLPTVSLRCCLGLAADELIHEEIHTFDSLHTFLFLY